MKRAFTLIEILITTGIIILLTVISIPAISGYGQRSAFSDKSAEVEMLFNKVSFKAKNPDKDITRYQANINLASREITLTDSSGRQVQKVELLPNQTIALGASSYNYLYCNVPGLDCGVGNISVTEPLGVSALFMTLRDDSGSSSLKTDFFVRGTPFVVEAK